MSVENPTVQIIIPTINLWKKYTKPCIDSIKTKYPHRILLIDNASTDETLVEAGLLVSDTFAHHRNSTVWSVSQSWNFGIKDAFERGYDFALVLNNDVLLHPEAIDKLIERMKNVNTGSTVPALATCMDVTGECPEPSTVFNLSVKDKENVPETEHPCFSGYMIGSHGWKMVGPFDENFKPAYYEDNDYHYRINMAGLKAIVVPTSMFYHYGSRTNAEAFSKPFIDSSVNHLYYVQKWGGNPGKEKFRWPFNKSPHADL